MRIVPSSAVQASPLRVQKLVLNSVPVTMTVIKVRTRLEPAVQHVTKSCEPVQAHGKAPVNGGPCIASCESRPSDQVQP